MKKILILTFSLVLVTAEWQMIDPFGSPQLKHPNLMFGDMLLTPLQQWALKNGKDLGGRSNGFSGVTDVNLRWKDAVIPYEIDCSLENLDKAVDAITKAMKEWETKTCIRFVKHTNEKYFLKFFRNTGCWGNVGQKDNVRISVGDNCEYQHVMTHEIGHVVGFYHEQNRKDRDDWVTVHWENIGASYKFNFDIVNNTDSYGVPYDYESIMHYPWNAFSANGKNTMSPKKDTKGKIPYVELSAADIKQVSLMYNCPAVERKRQNARGKRHVGHIKTKRSLAGQACIDDNQYCSAWAKAGYCSTDPYTQQHCKLSCGSPSCNKDKGCLDGYKNCPAWAKAGHCKINPTVQKQCKKSCDPNCKGAILPTTVPPITQQPPTSTPGSVNRNFLGKGVLCVDKDKQCPGWARNRQCESNPVWMKKNCMKSCKVKNCDPIGLRPRGSCANPLGLSWDGTPNFKIPDSAFYSPTTLSPGDWKASAKNARLYFEDDSKSKRIGAWCAASHNKAKSKDGYVQVDLQRQVKITYIATQGRYKYFERVGRFKIQYSSNGSSYKTYQVNGVDKVFDGNCDHVTPVLNKFPNPITARYIRYIPVEWNFPCVRMEFYGC